MHSNRTRGHGHRLQQGQCQWGIMEKKTFITSGVVPREDRGGEISVFGDIKNSAGQGPEQHDLTLKLAPSCRGGGPETSRGLILPRLCCCFGADLKRREIKLC